MLEQWLVPQLGQDLDDDFIFQQDGTPPHFHNAVRAYLNTEMSDRWIGRAGELVVSGLSGSGHDPGTLTSCPESSGSVQCTSQHSFSHSARPPSSLPVSPQIHPHGVHMPALYDQTTTAAGKGVTNRWQARTKNIPRQQLQNTQQQKKHLQSQTPLTSSGYQLPQTNGPFLISYSPHQGSRNQQLVVLDPKATNIPTTSQTLLLSPKNNQSVTSHSVGRTVQLQPQGHSQSTTPTLYPILQINPCLEHIQNSTYPHGYCIIEGIFPNSATSQLTIPCVVPVNQTKTNTHKSHYNSSSSNLQSLTINNKLQPQTQFRYQQQKQQRQQYSAARYQQVSPSLSKQQQSLFQTVPQQSQLVVFRPPPREKIKSPASQSENPAQDFGNSPCSKIFIPQNAVQSETTEHYLNSNTSRIRNIEKRKDSVGSARNHSPPNNMSVNSNQNVQQNSNVVFTSGISSNSPEGIDVVTSIQSTWLSTQPLGNVHLIMGLSAGNASKKQETNENVDSLPNPIARPTSISSQSVELENVQLSSSTDNDIQTKNLHLQSDSSTSFDFSIEAEKMVSALCNSTPLKDIECRDNSLPIENMDKSHNEGTQLLVRRNSEGHLVSLGRLKEFNDGSEPNLSNNPISTRRESKLWASAAATESSDDDAVSINSNSSLDFQTAPETLNLHAMIDCESERNITVSPLRLSPSSNSSASTAKINESKRNSITCLQENFVNRTSEVTGPRMERSEESVSSKRKLKNASCQKDIWESAYDEQRMFREITVKGCYEISKIIEEYIMSPSLESLNKFCMEVQQAVSKPENLLSESVQKDVIMGFLRLANCWTNLYPCLGISQYKLDNLDTVNVEVSRLYQNWTCASRKLMEGLIKLFENQVSNTHVEHTNKKDNVNLGQVHQSDLISYDNQEFACQSDCTFGVSQGIYSNNNYSSTAALADVYGIVTTESSDSPLVLASISENVIPGYNTSPIYDVRSSTVNHGHIQNNLTTSKSNWRLRRFTELQSENAAGTRNQAAMRKNKASFQTPKENNRRWNMTSSESTASFHSTYTNPKYSETPHSASRKMDDAGTNSSRASRSEPQVTNDRYNRHHVSNRFKQKGNTTCQKSTASKLNVETHLRDKAIENVASNKHWKHQQSDLLQVNQKTSGHEVYVGKISIDEVDAVPKHKMTPLSQIETGFQSPTQQVDLSSWFQNLGGTTLPISLESSHVTHYQNSPEYVSSDRRNQSNSIMNNILVPNQDSSATSTVMSSQQSALHYSYQDKRNQLISGKGKTWSNKRNTGNNYVSKKSVTYPATNHTSVLISQQCDEHDSSDDLQDRVYMKPGSYDVPKRRPSVVSNRNATPFTINNNAITTQRSPSPVTGVIVPFPAAPIVLPPSRSKKTAPSIFRHILTSESQDKTTSSPASVRQNNVTVDTSDLAWKAACASAGTLLETLQASNRSPKPEASKDTELERGEHTISNKTCIGNESSEGEDDPSPKCDDESKEKLMCFKKNKSIPERRKTNVVKTDDWLISTLNNKSKLRSHNETKDNEGNEAEISSSDSARSKVNNTNKSCEETATHTSVQKGSDSSNPVNVQKPTSTKNMCNRRKQEGKKDDEQTLRSRKSANATTGKKSHSHHNEAGRSNSDSRKRKLNERSPREDQTEHINSESSVSNSASTSEQTQTVQPVCNNKNKNDIRNKATWNVWYSSRRRRGLSSIAVNKLEDILNVVWNMDASDFIKYPVSSNDNDFFTHIAASAAEQNNVSDCLAAAKYELQLQLNKTKDLAAGK
ncbi:hypothetical protein ANN_16019 [Periplaneta americana]|uniref:Uncharacterized protein n=1 Tax=Periplaneta americana TaxID=6978 RepID=A0ABQ8SHT4_PERAM|nr:hypothetical protein ANN_16019 [Periplaneta americana]